MSTTILVVASLLFLFVAPMPAMLFVAPILGLIFYMEIQPIRNWLLLRRFRQLLKKWDSLEAKKEV